MKRAALIFGILIPIFFIVALTGLYPVALVNTSPVFYRTWQRAERAAVNFTNTEAKSRREGKPLDFSSPENIELLLDIKRNTLTFLIEDAIIAGEGEKLISGFTLSVREKVVDAIQAGRDLERAARLVYGLDFQDFRNIVLVPQARRDVMREDLKRRNQDFEKWLIEAKKTARVTLLFVPFRWDGEMVR